jgi:hypothetical protein
MVGFFAMSSGELLSGMCTVLDRGHTNLHRFYDGAMTTPTSAGSIWEIFPISSKIIFTKVGLIQFAESFPT